MNNSNFDNLSNEIKLQAVKNIYSDFEKIIHFVKKTDKEYLKVFYQILSFWENNIKNMNYY